MKKIPIFLLTLTICAAFNTLISAKTQALFIAEDGATWWSVEDLLEFSEIAEAEEEELCGDRQDCREELFFSRFESEDKRYEALEMLKEGRFWVTSVNPTAETLEVLYFDEDEMLKRWGIEEIQPLDFIFLAWFNQINGQIGNYNHYLPIEPQFSDDLHLLYADSADSFSPEGYPANTPFELSINSTNLTENTLGYIYIAVFGDSFNSKGYLDYSSCLEDYREGETCELMFSPGRGYSYLPSRETNEQTESETTEEFEIASQVETESPDETETEDLGIVRKITESENRPKLDSIKAPNTGGNIASSCEKVVEFPWWLGILLIIGNITVLWFFGPKKSIKSLDKKQKVR